MLRQYVSNPIREFREFLLDFLSHFVEPEIWNNFLDSFYAGDYNVFTIRDDDIPAIRDLKASLNMLSVIERNSDRSTWFEHVLKTIDLPVDFVDFLNHYETYRSTDSTVSEYLSVAKIMTFNVALPALKNRLLFIRQMCSMSNVENLNEQFIDKMVVIQHYQQQYLDEVAALKAGKSPKEKDENDEGIVTTVAKLNHKGLQLLYRDRFDHHFAPREDAKQTAASAAALPTVSKTVATNVSPPTSPESAAVKQDAKKDFDKLAVVTDPKTTVKADLKLDSTKASTELKDKAPPTAAKPVALYPEHKDDTDTIKHLKKLANGIIAIKKALDDYAAYSKSSGLTAPIGWLATFVYDLRQAYNFLQTFDYQAIMAEQANPIADFVKKHLQELNLTFQRLACWLDQFEVDNCLKENSLGRLLTDPLRLYNNIIEELEIPIDYTLQNRLFLQAKMAARERYLQQLFDQIAEIASFIGHKNTAMSDIPHDVIRAMQQYIARNEKDFCVNRKYLAKYKKYLADVLTVEKTNRTAFFNVLESVANSLSMTTNHVFMRPFRTIHSAVMKAFEQRLLGLLAHRDFIFRRVQRIKQQLQDEPFTHFQMSEVKASSHQEFILKKLTEHSAILRAEKDRLFMVTLDSKSSVTITGDQKATPKAPPSQRMQNKLIRKAKEVGALDIAMFTYQDTKSYPAFVEAVRKGGTCYSKATVMLLEDIFGLEKVPEEKTTSLALA
jgi:hypothetical protein